MSGGVPVRRLVAQHDGILIGKAVRSPHLFDVGAQANWLNGRASVLIPLFDPFITVNAGATATMRWRVETRYAAIQLIWLVFARSLDGTGRASAVQLAAPTGTTLTSRVAAAAREATAPLVLVQNLASQNASEVELSLDVKAIDFNCEVYGVACFEMPRLNLAQDANEYGVDLLTLGARQPIYDGAAGQSIDAVAEAVKRAKNIARRNGMLMWAVPEASALTTTSAVLVDLATVDAPALARCLFRDPATGLAELTRTVAWRVRVKIPNDGLTTGEIVVQTTRGGAGVTLATISIPVNSGAGAFHYLPSTAGAPSTFLLDCDDLTQVDGRQAPGGTPRFDFIKFRWRRTAGTGTVECNGVFVFEPAP